ncbi:MAG: hypothetical protein JXQ76_02610 [Campylobacterales bacterium]|nr:hypothetical protein [Campylobacterales bacterium]
MRMITLWIVIISLSFATLHDLFVNLEPTSTKSASICMADSTTPCDRVASCEVHNLLHFVAILDRVVVAFHPIHVSSLPFAKTTPHLSTHYQTLYRPPIA